MVGSSPAAAGPPAEFRDVTILVSDSGRRAFIQMATSDEFQHGAPRLRKDALEDAGRPARAAPSLSAHPSTA